MELRAPASRMAGQPARVDRLLPLSAFQRGQAREKGLLTSGTYGRLGTTSSRNAALGLSLANRLRLRVALLGSTLFRLTWRRRVTPAGAVDLCAAGVGAPHIRQRLWFVAYAAGQRRESGCNLGRRSEGVSPKKIAENRRRTANNSNDTFYTHVKPEKVNGFWAGADWIRGRDGVFRAVEPGTFPLANGLTARVGRLRGYGHAINAQTAQTFIQACM